MIKVNAAYLGDLRGTMGCEQEPFTLEDRATVYSLRRLAFRRLGPKAAGALQGMVTTLDHRQVALNHILVDGDTVAFLPRGLKTTGHGER
jgi:molybdopterin converting factor small subunit